MRFLYSTYIYLMIKAQNFLSASELDPNTDPLDTLSKGVKNPDKYSRAIIQNLYQVILVVFIAGAAVTFIMALIKLLTAPAGKSRSEAKSELVFRLILIGVFFSMGTIFTLIVNALQGIV